MRQGTAKLLLWAGLVVALGGCAGSLSSAQTTANLTPAEQRAFEHGADFIATLSGLEGRWRDEWEEDLRTRAASSDLIAVVTVTTVRTDIDPEQRETHRLFGRVDRVMHGEQAKEIEVAVREGVAGFYSVHSNIDRLQGQKYIAFVKWFRSDTGAKAAHWHFSPASEEVITATEQAIGQFSDSDEPRARVIVHTN